jgi:hypothetical protein
LNNFSHLLSVGIETQLEQSIRSCFRFVYFDSIRLHAHRGCLLNVILYKQPIWFQARLVYLLFGPMSGGKGAMKFSLDLFVEFYFREN